MWKPNSMFSRGVMPHALQFFRHRLAIEPFDPDRKVIDDARGRLHAQRHENLPADAKAGDLVRFVLIHHGETEDAVVEID